MRKQLYFWIGALVLGALLGTLGIAWLDKLMTFVATVYTRLFQLLAVPTIVLAVITTLASFGSQGQTRRIFIRTVIYTLLTTFSAAAVGLLLYIIIAPGNLPLAGDAAAATTEVKSSASSSSSFSVGPS